MSIIKANEDEIFLITLARNHVPLSVVYNDKTSTIYASAHKKRLYINVNSLCTENFTSYTWKRKDEAKKLIARFNTSVYPFKSYYSNRKYGTWILKELFTSFGNLMGEKTGKPNFGTIVNKQLVHAYKEWKKAPETPSFREIKTNNKDIRLYIRTKNDQIVLTDICTAYDKDIRNWKKNKMYHSLIKEDKNAVDSSKENTDYFGFHITTGSVDAAYILTEWCNNNSPNQEIYDQIIDFINDNVPEPVSDDDDPEEQPGTKDIIVKGNNPVQKLNLMNLTPDDFKDIRITPDGLFSVYDAIAKFKGCNLRNACQFFKNLEVFKNVEHFQKHKFEGRGQRETPVASFNQLLQILSQLPGEQAKVLRREQAEISTRAIAGDEDLEEAVREQRNKVSDSDREVLMNGLESSSDRRRLVGIDMAQYAGQSGLYLYNFERKDDVICDPEINEEGGDYYGFGVTSHPEKRPAAYRNDKDFGRVQMIRYYPCDSRSKASRMERRIKDIVEDLGIRIRYGKKIECFMATEDDLAIIHDEMTRIMEEKENSSNGDVNIELEKHKIEMQIKTQIKMQILKELFSEGKLTFEQFQKCLEL